MKKEIFAIGFLLLISCATQGDLTRIEQHLVYLNGKIEDLEKNQQKLENAISSQQADLLVQVSPLQDKIKELRGQREETVYELQQLSQRIEETNKKIEHSEKRLAELEAKLEKTIKMMEEKSIPSSKTQKEEGLYKKGLNLFRQKEYEKAIAAFNKFLKLYPLSPLAGNAQFWLGEAYFAQKKYEEAILAYQRVIKNYPKNIKVPAALFKQGKAFAMLGDNETAQILWKQVIKKYPKTKEANLAQQALKKVKK